MNFMNFITGFWVSNLLLILSANAQTDCPKSCKCPNKVFVNCKSAGLTAIPAKFPSTAERIDLSMNSITTVGDNAFSSANLTNFIDLRHNSISTISGLAFAGIEDLKTLYLVSNQLKDDVDLTSLSGKNALGEVYLSFNQFTKIPPIQSPSLRRLVLDGNRIQSAAFPKSYKVSTQIQSIVLSHNNVGALDSTDFSNLPDSVVSLDLKLNSISQIDPAAFTPVANSLETLNLDDNQLDESGVEAALFGLAKSGAPNLLTLSLNNNKITKIDAQIFKSLYNGRLRNLQLDRNIITSIDAKGFANFEQSLELLSMRKCGLTKIGIDLSQYLRLINVALDGNHLTSLPPFLPKALQRFSAKRNFISNWTAATFKGLSSLVYLDLSENQIKVLDNPSVNSMGDSLTSMKQLNLLNNPFNCSCDLEQFMKFAEGHATTIVNWNKYTCFTPSEKRGTLLSKWDFAKDCDKKLAMLKSIHKILSSERRVVVEVKQSLLPIPEMFYLLLGILTIMLSYVGLKQVLKQRRFHQFRYQNFNDSDGVVFKTA